MMEIDIQSCDLKFFLENQNSDHAWIKPGKYRLLNIETVTSGGGYDTRQVAWLIRTVERTPESIKVVDGT